MSRGSDLIKVLGLPGYGSDEVTFMEEACVIHQPKFIGDWGTNRGSSARIFWEVCRIHHIDAVIHTVELPLEVAVLDVAHSGEATGLFVRGRDRVTLHQGDGVTEALTAWARAGRPRALFFVDGEHMYWNVYRELALLNRAAPEAVLLLHDSRQGPGQAVTDWMASTPGQYRREDLWSQEGMTRLWPT